MNKLITYIFLLISTFAFSQNKTVAAEIDTTNIRIGEQFIYKISVDGTQNVIIPKLSLRNLEVVDSLKTDTIKNRLVKKYLITGFDSGAFYIPQQQIFVKNKAYLTDSLLVNVATVPVDTTKIKKFDIKGVVKEPYQFDDFRYEIYGLIFLLILIGALLYFFVFRNKKKEDEEIIVHILPIEEAIENLKSLDDKLLWQNNKIKQYYSELTDIVRNYIEREVNIPALESTTDELIMVLSDLQKTNLINTEKEVVSKLKALLQEADLVKFAKSKPIALEIEQDRKDAEFILNNLKSKPVNEEEDAE